MINIGGRIKYELKQQWKTPWSVTEAGTVKTEEEWFKERGAFHSLLTNSPDWFVPVPVPRFELDHRPFTYSENMRKLETAINDILAKLEVKQ